MKKGLTTFLVILLAVGAMLVSCKAEVATPADELVSVSFEMDSSRALSATLEEFDSNQFVWKYSAKKDASDTTGLISGQTANYDTDVVGAAYVAGPTVKGLAGKQVTGFSQGIWDFKLFAYNDDENIVYSGEVTGVTLKKSGTISEHTVKVTVSPVTVGDGKLVLDMPHITIKAASDKSTPSVSSQHVVTDKDGHVVNTAPTVDPTTHEVTYTLPAGVYKVTVTFKDAYGIVYAEGSVLATVYPYLKTRITGDLSELITYAQFEAEQNPDAVKVSAESEELKYDELITGSVIFSNTPETPEDKTVKATMNQADVNAIIKEMAINAGVDKSDSTLKLTLNVDPTAATENEITYEIGMTAKLTTTTGTTTSSVESDVKNLDNYVVVEISMEKNLLNVAVNHDGTPMYQYLTKAAFDAATSEVPGYSGFFFYDAENGALYIKTKSFSPFSISFEVPGEEDPVYEARIGSTMYEKLNSALKASKAGDTVVLLKNLDLEDSYISLYNKTEERTYVLDLNGFTIKSNGSTFIVRNGSLKLTGNGSVVSNGYTIWVGDYLDPQDIPAKLIIDTNVSVISTSDYAVVVYGLESSNTTFGQYLEVSGKIISAGPCIGGNGNQGNSKTSIEIKDGAVLSSEDVAIYHPQRGSLTIGSATISGKTAIEMKSGAATLTTTGSPVITATAEAKHVANSNGNSTEGYAIAAVENSDYYGAVAITLKNGTYNGPVAIVADNVSAEAKQATIKITGGSFSVAPDTAYLAEGYGIAPTVGIVDSKSETAPIVRYEVKSTWLANTGGGMGYDKVEGGKTYHIASAQSLASFAKLINNLPEEEKSLKHNAVLEADIDLSEYAWIAFDLSKAGSGSYFDGNGHTIRGLRVYGTEQVGLFSNSSGVTIKNLKIEDACVVGNHYVAAIVGYGYTTIENCSVKNAYIQCDQWIPTGKTAIDDGDKAGAIVGYLCEERALDAHDAPNLTGSSVENCIIKAFRDLGGLAGIANGTAEVSLNSVKDVLLIKTSTAHTTVAGDVGRIGEKATVKNNALSGIRIF